MKKLFFLLFALGFANLCLAQTMYIHTNNGVDNYNLADVDSITFSLSSSLPTEGLVAYYPFNGNANDESGNGHNGTVNGATLTSDRSGNTNSAYSFDGINDYIEVNHHENFNFGNDDFTFCAWIYLKDYPNNGCDIVSKMSVERTGSAHGDGYGPTINVQSNGYTYINVQEAGLGGIAHWQTALNLNQWYFFVGVRKNNTVYLYMNADIKASGACSKNGDNETTLVIGADIAAGDERWFNGMIDDVRIYNRALSEEELTQLYNSSN